ncbi:MAG: hypothetical protein ACE5KK_03520 [Candidatus Brocadiales bacterium]
MFRNTYHPFSILALLLFIIGGCAELEKAPREHTVRLIKPVTSDELRFDDENVRLRFTVTQRQIYFTLWNKTQGPISIIWDEVIFRDPEGATHWVLNNEEEEEHAVPSKAAHAATTHHHLDSTQVPAGSSHTNYIRPFPAGFRDILVYPSKHAAGARLKVTLPLEIQGRIKVYTFGFEVVD